MGCDADWAPGCEKAALTRDATGVYSATDQMVTLPGSFQKALGCTDNWKPECLAPLMEPVGNGTYTYSTTALPEGEYEFKVAIRGSDNENYGQDGAVGGANYQFATKANKLVTFTYDSQTHKVAIASADAPVAGGRGEQRAYWVTSNILAWPTSLLPEGVTRAQVLDGSAAFSYELVTAPEGGAGLSDGAVTGATTAALTVAGDLPAEVTTAHPNLNGYIALKASPRRGRGPRGPHRPDRGRSEVGGERQRFHRRADRPRPRLPVCGQGHPGLVPAWAGTRLVTRRLRCGLPPLRT